MDSTQHCSAKASCNFASCCSSTCLWCIRRASPLRKESPNVNEYYERRRRLDLENQVRAEAEARALELEAVRMRNFQARDPLAERRRLERENEAAAKLEAELDME